ncbi:MAG: hypothetical protein K0R08_910 [Solimicrobium sp.]|jgi:uncharacterized RDD family membrane protein YckC|nr:hypothetical protein [Solimicrobium sp.]
MLYEAVLLFGIFFSADFLFDLLIQSHNESILRHGRQLYLFLVIGAYFIYFWRHSGQTLPMQTWRIKIVARDMSALTFKQACLRYCAAWMWVFPALACNYLFGIKQWPGVIVFFIGLAAWAFMSHLDKNGQFIHDKFAGTQLISLPKKKNELK